MMKIGVDLTGVYQIKVLILFRDSEFKCIFADLFIKHHIDNGKHFK